MWVSLWGRRLQLAHPISHQFSFIFHSISPVTVYDFSLYLLSRARLGKWVNQTQQINEKREEKKKPAPSLSAQRDRSDKKRHPRTRARTRTEQRRVGGKKKATGELRSTVLFCLWLNLSWRSLKQGLVSTIESTSSRDRPFLTVTVAKPLHKEDSTLSIRFPIRHTDHRLLGTILKKYTKRKALFTLQPFVFKLCHSRFLCVCCAMLQETKWTCRLLNRC